MTARERILRSGLFDEAFYRSSCPPESGQPGTDPLGHYLAEGAADDLNPHPLFDSAYYRERCGGKIPSSMSPLEHYLVHGKHSSPHPLFDPQYYLAVHRLRHLPRPACLNTIWPRGESRESARTHWWIWMHT
jgi:hypothetical protein